MEVNMKIKKSKLKISIRSAKLPAYIACGGVSHYSGSPRCCCGGPGGCY